MPFETRPWGNASGPRPAPSAAAAQQYPLSQGQRALWFVQQLEPDSAAYNIARPVRIRAPLDMPAFQRTFQRIMDRHPALRTTFAVVDGEPVQRVHEQMAVGFCAEDATTWTDAQINERLTAEVFRPFDLARGPLMRLTVLSRAPEEHFVVLCLHHIVSDLWTLAIILNELGTFYAPERAGTPLELKPVRGSYAEVVRAQAEMLAGPEGERLWAYWREQLAGAPTTLNLPTDRPRPPIQSARGANCFHQFGPQLTAGFQALAQARGVPLHVVVLAAFQALLYRYTGQEDLLVGTPKANRSARSARLVGYLVNSVVLRSRLTGAMPFGEFLAQVQQTLQDADAHDTFPFSLLVERLNPPRDPSRSPLFQASFAWQKTAGLVDRDEMTAFALEQPGSRMNLPELPMEMVDPGPKVSQFDLLLLAAEMGEGIAAACTYNTDLWDAATIARMMGHLETMLEAIVADPEQPIGRLPLLTPAEREQLLVVWNPAPAPAAPGPCIHRLIEAQAARTPDAVALIADEGRLTYAELERQAGRLAEHLRGLGVRPGVFVGVSLERTPQAVVALLGVLKAGGVYLPLDPEYPAERLAFMLQDAAAPVLLTQRSLAASLPSGAARLVCLDEIEPDDAAVQPATRNPQPTPDDPAYIIYTSGSTGRPKGVLISHRALAEHCREIIRQHALIPADRVVQFASFNFDPSLEQILPTLAVGAAVALRGREVWSSAEFSRRVAAWGLTVANLPTAYWHQLIQDWSRAPETAPRGSLRLMIPGGDKVRPEVVRLWAQTPLRMVRLLNAYGPTETTITATLFEATPAFAAHDCFRVPIGRPLPGRRAYILDPWGQPTPIGVPGELYLGGAGLAIGYLNQPELTAERFIRDPFSDRPGDRLYRTGDLARFLPDGQIEFLGRVDQQVKVRGFRIELEEIEAVLGEHPAVHEAVARVVSNGADDHQQLVAYVVPVAGANPAAAELRAFLKARLPEYMIPAAFVALETLPLTPSGKVDRRALPAPDLNGHGAGPSYIAPRTPLERDLARLWGDLLHVEQVGVEDNFFDLGGHSLLATQLISRIRDALGIELHVRDLFDAPTVAGLTVIMARRQAEQEDQAELERMLDELDGLSPEEIKQLLNDTRSTEMGDTDE